MGAQDKVVRMTGKHRPPESARAARAASRTLDILEFVDRQGLPVSAAAIGAACGIPRSTLRDLLRMLETRGYLVHRAVDKGWVSGKRPRGSRAESLEFEQGLTVLELFSARGGGLTVEDIAERSPGLSGEVVERTLAGLAAFGLVVACTDGTYAPGRRLLGLASRIGWVEMLQVAARPCLTRLRDESGETSSLLLEDSGQALYLDQVESRFELRCRGWVGRRVPLESTSVGAAFGDPSRPHIVADAVEAGVTAIACAVPGIEPAVGVSIIGPSWRLEEGGLDRLARLVESAAEELAESDAVAHERAH
jgi:DNA-binding IclR family transcriptional regulator